MPNDLSPSLPCSDEAEKGLLSCLLQDPSLIPPCRSLVMELDDPSEQYGMFFHPCNRLMFTVLVEFSDKGRPIDIVTLGQHFLDTNQMDLVGGSAVLAELYSFIPTPAHHDYYLGMLRDKMLLRRCIRACVNGVSRCREHHEDVGVPIGQVESDVFQVLQVSQSRPGHGNGCVSAKTVIFDWLDHIQRVVDNRGKILGLTTGLHELDLTLHGIDDKEGEIVTVAGRPGDGKTAFGVSVIEHMGIEQGIPGAVFSVEMSLNQYMDRQILGPLRIDVSKAHTGMFNNKDGREEIRIGERARRIAKLERLFFNGTPDLTTADLRSHVHVLKRKHDIRWIAVDHLHLVKAVSKAAQSDERLRLVEVMETLQFIKKQFRVAVFLFVQMSRESDRNIGKAPVLADLAGSGAIEWYSDHVIFIQRPERYKPWHKLSEEAQAEWLSGHDKQRMALPDCWSQGERYPEDPNGYARQDYEEHALLYVRKNRRGPTPELAVRYQREFTLFSSRRAKLYSNKAEERQVGYQSKNANGKEVVAANAD